MAALGDSLSACSKLSSSNVLTTCGHGGSKDKVEQVRLCMPGGQSSSPEEGNGLGLTFTCTRLTFLPMPFMLVDEGKYDKLLCGEVVDVDQKQSSPLR